LIELIQVRRRHHDVTHRRGLLVAIQRGCRGSLGNAATHPQQDRLHVVARLATAHLDDALHLVDGVVIEQCQHAHVMLDAARRAVLLLQRFAQFAEDGRQLPTAKDVGVIERRRPVLQSTQVVLRIEDLLVSAVGTWMHGNYLRAPHHVDAVDISFNRDGLECRRPRHAVAVIVETHHLILVGLGGLSDARIEGRLGE
jgi:hypothetical protein